MLYKDTIRPATLELLTKLMNDHVFDKFFLVGGTALALRIGHRVSIDLDLFTTEPFDNSIVTEHIRSTYGFELDYVAKNTVKGEVDGIQLDFITHAYPIDRQIEVEEGIRIASLLDIAAMKLNAIIENGSRLKDFIDIAYLSSTFSLQEMIDCYQKKYNANSIIPVKAILYWNDIAFSEPIQMSQGKYSWEKVAIRLSEMADSPETVFHKIV